MFWTDLDEEKTLRMCSMAARGLWATHMLAIMAQAGGYLAYEGAPMSIRQLAGWVGFPADQVGEWLAELDDNKVFSRDRHGTPYNRRMLKAQKKAKTSRENGQKGGRRKSLEDNDDLDLLTENEPTANLRGNLSSGPRARVLTKSTLSDPMIYNSDRGEKNPARAHSNGHGIIGPDKVIARIIRTAERSDTEDNRAWAMHVLMMLDVQEAKELSQYATPAVRVGELIAKAEIQIAGVKKSAAEKRTKAVSAH